VGEEERRAAIRARARSAVTTAAATVAHSRALQSLLVGETESRVVSRCAWCSRYRIGDLWVALATAPRASSRRTSDSICDRCALALREAG
jgi:hypothetical protein